MTFECLIDPANGPRWQGLLPGAPDAFFLSRGEGEHAKLFGDLVAVLLSGDETEGQFGIITSQSPAGDIIPTHAHADTHETFYILDGQVRVFVQDRAGEKTSRLSGCGPHVVGLTGGRAAGAAGDDRRPDELAATRPLTAGAQSSSP
jgi:quercetin 2,3-dioxygenase